jgi:hypothetical protein
MRGVGSSKLAGGISAIVIFGILILSGPAQAFTLGLEILNPEVEAGENISFMASIDIEAEEFLEIDYLVLKLYGPSPVSCVFNINGSLISGCDGIFIEQISSSPYQYGYGFSEGVFRYNITLNTSEYLVGIYDTSLEIRSHEESFSQQGEQIIIRDKNIEELEKCSIRARDGTLMVNGINFGENNDLNFYLSEGSSGLGQGSLTGQMDRSRFSYDFDILGVIENNPEMAKILVSGTYRVNLGQNIPESALITFDKINNEISLVGDYVEMGDANIWSRNYC